MANQYTSSFNHVTQEKFGKSAQELLTEYANKKITYDEAAEMTGISISTIRKWCRFHNIFLYNKPSNKKQKPVEDFDLLATKDIFKTKKLNIENVLSRKWLKLSPGQTIC